MSQEMGIIPKFRGQKMERKTNIYRIGKIKTTFRLVKKIEEIENMPPNISIGVELSGDFTAGYIGESPLNQLGCIVIWEDQFEELKDIISQAKAQNKGAKKHNQNLKRMP